MRPIFFAPVLLAAACATGNGSDPAQVVEVYDVVDLVADPAVAAPISAPALAQAVRDAAGITGESEQVEAQGARHLVARASAATQVRIRQVLADFRRLQAQPVRPLRTESLTSDEARQVATVLDQLYRSFGHGAGEEPDWGSMRSVFVDGAQFVAEAAAGAAPKPQAVDDFVASWQAAVRASTTPAVASEEVILDKRITKVGKLIHVDVLFRAKKGTDAAPRKPGLDSLTLVDVGGQWKVLSFVVHYESKL